MVLVLLTLVTLQVTVLCVVKTKESVIYVTLAIFSKVYSAQAVFRFQQHTPAM